MASVRKRTWRDGKTAYVVDWIDKTGRRHNRQFRLYREADRFHRETERQLDANTFRPDANKLMLRDACLGFLDHCEGRQQRGERMTRHCLAVYRGHVQKHILNAAYGIGETTLARFPIRRKEHSSSRIRGSWPLARRRGWYQRTSSTSAARRRWRKLAIIASMTHARRPTYPSHVGAAGLKTPRRYRLSTACSTGTRVKMRSSRRIRNPMMCFRLLTCLKGAAHSRSQHRTNRRRLSRKLNASDRSARV
jgi:hypothetical protein